VVCINWLTLISQSINLDHVEMYARVHNYLKGKQESDPIGPPFRDIERRCKMGAGIGPGDFRAGWSFTEVNKLIIEQAHRELEEWKRRQELGPGTVFAETRLARSGGESVTRASNHL